MGLDLDFTDGKTPLTDDEKEGLLIKSISTRGELDEFEQHHIEKAMLWLRRKQFSAEEIISEKFVRDLHRRMYEGVWKRAGQFRRSEKNIGLASHQVSTSLRQLLGDCLFWFQHGTYPEEELVIRFKHRLVQIHCFANGNGRHSRLLADVMMEKIFHRKAFTWGAANQAKQGDPRTAYIKALKEADNGDYDNLIDFAKS